jgi:hypothetical protein
VPDYTFLHILGCTCYPLLRPYTQHKLEAQSEVCAFLGYSTIHKGYYCLHIPSGRIYVSQHVTFDDHTFPFMDQINSAHAPISSTSQRTVLTILPPVPMSNISSNSSQTDAPNTTIGSTSGTNTDITHVAETNSSPLLTSTTHITPPVSMPNPAAQPCSRNTPTHSMVTRSEINSLKPKQFPK